jgi:hypothetical protein
MEQVCDVSGEISYDCEATRTAIEQAGLTSRGRTFLARWLSAWHGGHLPTATAFPPERLQHLSRWTVICTVEQGRRAMIVFCGDDLARICGERLIGTDWLARVPKKFIPELLQRTTSVAAGAILRTVRHVWLDQGAMYSFEVVSVPMFPNDDGTVPIVSFFDWKPKDRKAALLNLHEILKPPAFAQFIPIVEQKPQTYSRSVISEEPGKEQRPKIISQAAVRLVIRFMCEAMAVHASAGLDPTDYLIAAVINSYNFAHIDTSSGLGLCSGAWIEASWMRRGISRAAVSRILHIPLETVRRRINRLIEKGILIERRDGIIVAGEGNFDGRPGRARFNAELVERLIGEIHARGILLD